MNEIFILRGTEDGGETFATFTSKKSLKDFLEKWIVDAKIEDLSSFEILVLKICASYEKFCENMNEYGDSYLPFDEILDEDFIEENGIELED